MRHITLIVALCFSLFALAPAPAQAGWPNWETVLDKIAPFIFTNPDEYEATKFSIKHPECAMTIVSYTAAQDYSLVGFIGTLKVTKLQSLPKIVPINGGNCKAMQPVRMAYEFVDKKGDDYLGKSTADFFRKLLADQIAEGKEALDAQIASIPYVGPIIENWDCECDAAFGTNFAAEKLADEIVGTAISIIKSVIAGNYGEALEKLVTKLGPPVACKLGLEFTGVGSIPVVSTFANQACSSIAGKAVEWIVDGAGAVGEALGIVGGEHIPPEQYYNDVMRVYVGNSDYVGWADALYNNCYSYFEPTNMAAATAKKVCAQLRARYVEESMGSIQWNAFQLDRFNYFTSQVRQKAIAAVMLDDDAFNKIKIEIETACNAYMGQKYPLADKYWNTYSPTDKSGTTKAYCHNIVTTDSKFDKAQDAGYARSSAQLTLMYEMRSKLAPLCSIDVSTRNLLKCQDGQGLDTCKQNLSAACVASTDSVLGGKAFPCCQGGAKPSDIEVMNAKAAEKMAAKVSEPYCFTEAKDPLRIVCTLKQAYERCQKSFQWYNQKDCSTAAKTGIGLMAEQCCTLDETRLPEVKGVTETKTALDKLNGKGGGGGASLSTQEKAALTGGAVGAIDAAAKGITAVGAAADADKNMAKALTEKKEDCALGGTFIAPSYEARVINCPMGRMAECKQTLGNDGVCALNSSGFAQKPCCEGQPFSGGGEAVKGLDCKGLTRSTADLQAAAKAVNDSKGNCSFGVGPDGKPDMFRVSCNSKKAYEACIGVLGPSAKRMGTCAKALCTDGTAYSPCCEWDNPIFGGISLIDAQKKVDKALLDGATNKLNEAVKGALKAQQEEEKKRAVRDSSGQKEKPSHIRKGAPVGDSSVLDIQLLKVTPKNGLNPFNAKAVRDELQPRDVAGSGYAPAPAAKKKGTAAKANPDTKPDDMAPTVLRHSGETVAATPEAFTCNGKPNGNYCKNTNTLVFCYMNGEANSQNCPSGCDAAAKACNPYKP